jgi:PASTA domain
MRWWSATGSSRSISRRYLDGRTGDHDSRPRAASARRGLPGAAGRPCVTDPTQDGRVVEQDPAAGTRVQGSTEVLIFVGRLTP